MTFDEYQIQCRKTDVGTAAQDCLDPGFLYYVLGVAGESGEFVEKVKKLFRDKKGIIDQEFIDVVIKEMGDILWYMARFSDQFDIDFNDVAETNITKLLSRLERGTLHGEGDNR
jgi:NTP pyrophosphatase (non-canonical NTP hydrolase)